MRNYLNNTLLSLLSISLLALPTQACLQLSGAIDVTAGLVSTVQFLKAVDNNVQVCNSGVLDTITILYGNQVFAATCNTGYAYAVTVDGTVGYYSSPNGGPFDLSQQVTKTVNPAGESWSEKYFC